MSAPRRRRTDAEFAALLNRLDPNRLRDQAPPPAPQVPRPAAAPPEVELDEDLEPPRLTYRGEPDEDGCT